MANPNFNAGAQGNPLDALLAQNKGNLWGNLGGLLYGHYTTTTNGGLAEDGSRYNVPSDLVTELDPRYQQAQAYLNAHQLTQLRNTNVGGPGGVIDPSQVTYDPTYGLVTNPSNLNALGETFLDKYGPWLMLAPAAYGVLAAGAAGELGGAAAGEAGGAAGTVGMSGAETIPEVAGADGSMTLPGAAGANAGGGAAAAGAAGSAAGSAGSSGGILSQAGDLAGQAGQWAMAHPMQALGLAQTAYGLLGGHGHGPSSSSSSSGSKGGGGTGNNNFTVPQRQFYVNPYIQAQINRGYGQ